MVSKYWPSIVLVIIGFLVFFVGYWLVTKNQIEVELYEAEDHLEIVVDIGGGVVKPGVYTLSQGSRLKDLLVLAGGLSHDADRENFDRAFNMAELVKDGEKIYIPKLTENNVIDSKIPDSTSGKISVNKATRDSLMTISGIGESRATKIIENRPYKSLEELVERKVLSQSLFEEIKSKLILW